MSVIRPASRPFRAFTLIELLVVLSVIALLMALLLPVLSKARQVATDTLCLSNQRQIYLALTMYAGQRNNEMPPVRKKSSSGNWHSGFWAVETDPAERRFHFYEVGSLVYGGYLSPGTHNEPGALLDPTYRPTSYGFGGSQIIDIYKPDGWPWGNLRDKWVMPELVQHRDSQGWGWKEHYRGPYQIASDLYQRQGWSYAGEDLTHSQRSGFPNVPRMDNLGVPGPTQAPDKTVYDYIRMTSLIQCTMPGKHPHVSEGEAQIDNPSDGGAHEARGWNSIFQGGHGRWIEMPQGLLNDWTSNAVGFYGNVQHSRHRGFWSYASAVDQGRLK